MKTKLYSYSIPLLIGYLVLLFIICLYPRRISIRPTTKKMIPIEQGQSVFPKEGDNIKIVNEAAVFRFEAGQRRKYPSAPAYLSANPPFGTVYDSGGILVITAAVAEQIPIGSPIPDLPLSEKLLYQSKTAPSKPKPFYKRIFRSDKAGHALGYFILGILLLIVLETKTKATPQKCILWLFVIGTSIGILLEFLQATLTANREAELLDVVFNTIGLWLSIWGYRKIK